MNCDITVTPLFTIIKYRFNNSRALEENVTKYQRSALIWSLHHRFYNRCLFMPEI